VSDNGSRYDAHADLGGYVLQALEPAERIAFERHLASCGSCRAELVELTGLPALLDRMAPAWEPPAGLEARVLVAVERAAAGAGDARPAPRRRRLGLRLALAPAAAALLALAVVAGTRLGGGQPGELELQATLTAPAGGAEASARVTRTGIGRVIVLRTDELPILPQGELYELWFVGPGDSPSRPNRISAGTFHPDENGRTHVQLAAAVDPAKYPVLSVTKEPADGDPRPGVEVLRSG
jgi:anti-sigma-K factor RskA